MNNIGVQLRLPKEDVEGIKLAAMGGSSKRDYLSFDCAMKEKGQVRLKEKLYFHFNVNIVADSTLVATVW